MCGGSTLGWVVGLATKTVGPRVGGLPVGLIVGGLPDGLLVGLSDSRFGASVGACVEMVGAADGCEGERVGASEGVGVGASVGVGVGKFWRHIAHRSSEDR